MTTPLLRSERSIDRDLFQRQVWAHDTSILCEEQAHYVLGSICPSQQTVDHATSVTYKWAVSEDLPKIIDARTSSGCELAAS